MKPLTTEQSQILREMINANWQADDTSNSYLIRDIERQRYYHLKHKLIDSIGPDEYNELMSLGKNLFAPSES